MRVMDVMSRKPVVVGPETSIEHSVKSMLKEGVGSLIVEENNILKGIVTEKDLVSKVILKQLDIKKISISKIMSTILITITPEADILDAVKLMTKYDIRRLPVVDSDNKLFGLLTVNDILRVQPQLFELIIDKSRLFSSRRAFIDSECSECKTFGMVRTVNGRFLCQDCERNESVINYMRWNNLMVKVSKVFNRVINLVDSDFKISEVYKKTKDKLESFGYILFEKEQSIKPTKYGEKLKFKFEAFKEFDYFGKADLKIFFVFTNLSRAKGLDHGDLKLTFEGATALDYKNRWGTSGFNAFLFSLYLIIKKNELKKKYIIPTIIESNKIYDGIKESLDEYSG